MKRSRFPYVIGTILLALTVGISLIGFFAYSNLNEIIGKLGNESRSDFNLLLLNNVNVRLQETEHAMERFVYDSGNLHLKDFHGKIALSVAILDTLRKQNSDQDFLVKIDSLESLIMDKSTILSQVASLDYKSMEEPLETLKNQLNDLQTTRISEDTILTKKRNFIDRLFGKEAATEVRSDTVNIYDTEEYQKIINSQLDSIANESRKRTYAQKLKEATLQRDHQDIQAKIASLLTRLEKSELDKIRSQANEASSIASSTNKYVTMFGIAIPLLLLVSISILYIFFSRTRKHQEILDTSRKNAIKLAKEKEQFLANMSHEIRTPMNAIGGFARLLLKSDLNKDQQEYLGIIDKSTEHLIHILNDVLDFSKLQSGKISLESKHFNPSEVLKDTIKLIQDRADEKHLSLDLEINNLPRVVEGDPYRLKQIILNLVYNGIKFTEKGGVSIVASIARQTKTKIYLSFEVMDTGIGIPTNRLKDIFNEFEQVNRDDRRKGTGLGLSITRKLVHIHNGNIKVHSAEGKGSTFTVTIPYLVSNQTEIKSEESLDTSPDLAGTHILISDDEEFNRKLLIAICIDQNMTYRESVDGIDTYEKLKEERFDAVLLDFRMPEMNGPEVAEKIRKENGPNRDIPIIGLTATVSDQDMKQAANSGINQVLRKPFDTNELLKLIAASKRRKNSDLAKAEKQSVLNIQFFDLAGLEKMGDEAFVIDMVETFISSTKQNLRDFNQCFEEKEWENCGEVLHKVISPARHLKADKLVTLLKEVEISSRKGNPISSEEHKLIMSQVQNLVDSLEVHLQETV